MASPEPRVPARAAAEKQPAASALVLVSDDEPGIRRLRRGKGFSYVHSGTNEPVNPRTVARIKALAIPPAWRDVWIARTAHGHIQATGRDARGRKQYIYHPDWRAARDGEKYARLAAFGKALRRIRNGVDTDLRRHGLVRRRVLAAVVALLDQTAIRIGNDQYARENGSAGLTTLQRANAQLSQSVVSLDFTAKGGKRQTISAREPRVARVLLHCSDVAGDWLFCYEDEGGAPHRITSADVNEYIRELSGADFSAKDFRTWHGTVAAARFLAEQPVPSTARELSRTLNAGYRAAAERLGNTPAVCRESYVHPQVPEAFESGRLQQGWSANRSRWARQQGDPAERLLLWLL